MRRYASIFLLLSGSVVACAIADALRRRPDSDRPQPVITVCDRRVPAGYARREHDSRRTARRRTIAARSPTICVFDHLLLALKPAPETEARLEAI